MANISPFELAQGISKNLSGGVRQYQDRRAMDEILKNASNINSPQEMQNMMTQIIQRVSPEKQQQFMQLIGNMAQNQQADRKLKAQQSYYTKEGLDPEFAYLDPSIQKEIIKNRAIKNSISNAYQVATEEPNDVDPTDNLFGPPPKEPPKVDTNQILQAEQQQKGLGNLLLKTNKEQVTQYEKDKQNYFLKDTLGKMYLLMKEGATGKGSFAESVINPKVRKNRSKFNQLRNSLLKVAIKDFNRGSLSKGHLDAIQQMLPTVNQTDATIKGNLEGLFNTLQLDVNFDDFEKRVNEFSKLNKQNRNKKISPIKTPQKYQIGQTAVNPQTGQTLTFNGVNWE